MIAPVPASTLVPPVFVQRTDPPLSLSASGPLPSCRDSVPALRRALLNLASTYATAVDAESAALSTHKLRFGPSAVARLLRPLLTSLPTSLRLATSVAFRHRQGSPQVSHVRFTSYPSDLRNNFPVQFWVNRFQPALPVVPPQIRFLYVGLTFCYRLPSPVRCLPSSVESLDLPLNRRSVDFHHINTRALLGALKKKAVRREPHCLKNGSRYGRSRFVSFPSTAVCGAAALGQPDAADAAWVHP